MTWRELVVVEWECDDCTATVIGDEGLPDGWELGIDDRTLCGCCRRSLRIV